MPTDYILTSNIWLFPSPHLLIIFCLRIQAGYSSVSTNLRILNGHLAAIKSLTHQKRSKNSLTCLWDQNSVKNHRKSMRRKHIGLMTSQSAKRIFAQSKRRILHSIVHPFSKVPAFNDQALFWCCALIGQWVCTAWQKVILSDGLCYRANFLS